MCKEAEAFRRQIIKSAIQLVLMIDAKNYDDAISLNEVKELLDDDFYKPIQELVISKTERINK